MKTIMSVDLEYDWDSKRCESIKVVPKLLDFFDDHDIRATFFVVTDLMDKNESLIKEIAKKHEIASHSCTHAPLTKVSREQLEKEVRDSKKKIESLKIRCKGFRAPMYLVPKNLHKLLKKHSYKYDSSHTKSIFPGRYFNLTQSTKIYEKDGITEIPISTFKLPIPFGLSYMRLLYPFSRYLIKKKPVIFYLHPYELTDLKPKKEVPFYVKSLAMRRMGKKAWETLEETTKVLNTKFVACEDYLEI